MFIIIQVFSLCIRLTCQYKRAWTVDCGRRTADCGLRAGQLGIKHGPVIKNGLWAVVLKSILQSVVRSACYLLADFVTKSLGWLSRLMVLKKPFN